MNGTFEKLCETRFSLRNYDATRTVEPEKIDYILSCVRLAPSAVNLQPYRFLVISNKALLAKIAQCYHRDWFAAAPVCIVACANHAEAWHRQNDGKDHADIDTAIAIDHLTLAAAEQGVGTCWVCNFDARQCAEILGLSAEFEPVALIPLGYAADDGCAQQKKRKSNEELFQMID